MIKVRSIRRKSSNSERWSIEEFNQLKGTPWEPEPGRPGVEIGTRVRIPAEMNEDIEEAVPAEDKEIIARRVYIK